MKRHFIGESLEVTYGYDWLEIFAAHKSCHFTKETAPHTLYTVEFTWDPFGIYTNSLYQLLWEIVGTWKRITKLDRDDKFLWHKNLERCTHLKMCCKNAHGEACQMPVKSCLCDISKSPKKWEAIYFWLIGHVCDSRAGGRCVHFTQKSSNFFLSPCVLIEYSDLHKLETWKWRHFRLCMHTYAT